jgi:hypothetical protein
LTLSSVAESAPPSAAYFRHRAEVTARFAYERDSKRATLLALDLLALADVLATAERAS